MIRHGIEVDARFRGARPRLERGNGRISFTGPIPGSMEAARALRARIGKG